MSSIVAFSYTLHRYTTFNFLVHKSQPVLQNPALISKMLIDLNKVDFANIRVRKDTNIHSFKDIFNYGCEFTLVL